MSWLPVQGLTVAQKLGSVEPAINKFSSGLNTAVAPLNTILKLLEASQQDYADPTAALATAVITELENLVKDLAGISGYMLINLPQDVHTPNGWSDWVSEVVASFDDAGDDRRLLSHFSDSAVCGGLVLVAGSASLQGFLEALKPLAVLFDLNGFDEKLAQILASQSITPAPASQYPDWKTLQARDIAPVSQIETELSGVLANLKSQTQKADSVFKLFAQELKERINTLKNTAEQLKQLAKVFGADLNKTGFWQLEIPEKQGGVNYYKQQLIQAKPPGFSDTSYIAGVALCGGAGTLAGLKKIF